MTMCYFGLLTFKIKKRRNGFEISNSVYQPEKYHKAN